MKMRRSRFHDLSLAKPKSFSDLDKKMQIKIFHPGESSESSPRRRKSKRKNDASPELILPPISITNGSKTKPRKKEVQKIVLPDIHQNNSRTSTNISGKSY